MLQTHLLCVTMQIRNSVCTLKLQKLPLDLAFVFLSTNFVVKMERDKFRIFVRTLKKDARICKRYASNVTNEEEQLFSTQCLARF